MSLRPRIGTETEDLSQPHEPVVLEPYENADSNPLEAYELDLWDQMSKDMQRWNRDFSYDRRHPVGNDNPLQMLAVAYGEKPGHDLGDGLGSVKAVEEAIDYARDLGLTVVYRWNGIDKELVEDGHEIYVTKDPELAELASEQPFSFYEDSEVYGQLMGFPEQDIEAYEDWNELGRQFEPSEQKSMQENLDERKQLVTSKGGFDSVISHRGVVREMIKGKDYNFDDFLGAFKAFDNRVLDTEDRIDQVVESVRRLNRKLEEDTGKGIAELETESQDREVFREHQKHYREKLGKEKGLSRYLPDFLK